MKRILALTCFAFTFLAVLSCREVQFNDGKIPQGYEQYARQAEGSYSGYVENQSPSGLVGPRRPITIKVTYVNDRIALQLSDDWLGAGCGSKVGNLLSAEISGNELTTATFAFDGGSCKTADTANEFVVRSFDQGTRLAASVTTSLSTRTEYGGVPRHTVHEARGVLKKD